MRFSYLHEHISVHHIVSAQSRTAPSQGRGLRSWVRVIRRVEKERSGARPSVTAARARRKRRARVPPPNTHAPTAVRGTHRADAEPGGGIGRPRAGEALVE